MCRRVAIALLSACAFTGFGCGGSDGTPTGPTSTGTAPVPATSRLTYQVPAAANHGAASGSYTTENASFRGSVRTTCVPNPTFGSVCPDLMVMVQPANESFCQLWVFAPLGETLVARTYSRAQRGHSAGVAGFDLNCSKGGTACNWSFGQFTIHQLQSDANGTVTRLHITFEQTCSDIGTLRPTGGMLTGELWIVDGTTPFR